MQNTLYNYFSILSLQKLVYHGTFLKKKKIKGDLNPTKKINYPPTPLVEPLTSR